MWENAVKGRNKVTRDEIENDLVNQVCRDTLNGLILRNLFIDLNILLNESLHTVLIFCGGGNGIDVIIRKVAGLKAVLIAFGTILLRLRLGNVINALGVNSKVVYDLNRIIFFAFTFAQRAQQLFFFALDEQQLIRELLL